MSQLQEISTWQKDEGPNPEVHSEEKYFKAAVQTLEDKCNIILVKLKDDKDSISDLQSQEDKDTISGVQSQEDRYLIQGKHPQDDNSAYQQYNQG